MIVIGQSTVKALWNPVRCQKSAELLGIAMLFNI